MGALIGGLARGALGAFTGAGWITQLITVGVLVGSLATAYGVWHHQVWQGGYDSAIEYVAEQDRKRVERAKELRDAWRACRDAQRVWSQAEGKCG